MDEKSVDYEAAKFFLVSCSAFTNYLIEKARKEGYLSIKVDTHPDNFRMQNLIKSMGFVEIGFMIQMHRIGYELVLS